MARLPRLAADGELHLVVQRGHNRQPAFVDDADRAAYLEVLRDASHVHGVVVHAYALLDSEVWLLVQPATAAGLSRAMQALGRRYVAAFNRRHGRSGTLWEGRFRATVLDAQTQLLDVLVHLDHKPVDAGLAAAPADWPWSSAAHRLGRRRDPLLTDPPGLWALGNTPFERESSYGRRLEAGLPAARRRAIDDAALRGWALGPASYLAALAGRVGRPVARRPRGRPAKDAPDVVATRAYVRGAGTGP